MTTKILNQTCNKLRCLLIYIISTSVFASNGHVFLGAIVGSSSTSISHTNPSINYYDGYLTDDYPIHERHTTNTVVGINGGYEFVGTGRMPAISVGVGIYPTQGNANYTGQLVETALGDPSSTLYNYQFQLTSSRLMLESQLTWTLFDKISPFINIGIGSARTRFSGYSESVVGSTGYVALPPFQSHTNTNFAYQIGVGIGYAFNFVSKNPSYPQERISLGYRYVNLGSTSSGLRGAVYPYKLNLGKITQNELYLSYTHLFL